MPSFQRQGYGSHPPPRRGSLPLWTDAPIPLLPRLPASRRIYCNRALNMKQIKVQGAATLPHRQQTGAEPEIALHSVVLIPPIDLREMIVGDWLVAEAWLG